MAMRNNKATEKAKDFKGSLRKLLIYCKRYLPVIIACAVFAVLSAVLSVIGPNQISELTNEIVSNLATGINLATITKMGIGILTIYLFSALFDILQGLLMATAEQKISKELRRDINNKLNRLPLKYIDANQYGDLMSRATNDVDTISSGFNSSVTNLFSSVCLFFACLVMMFVTNWIMAITAIISCLLGFSFIVIIMKASQKHFVAQQINLGNVNGHIEEIFTAHDIVNVYNAVEVKKKQFTNYNDRLYKSTWKSQFLSSMMPNFMQFIGNLGYVAVCVVGAVLVAGGEITTGVIVAFILYVKLFSNPLTQIAQDLSGLQSTVAASERVFEILDQQEIKDDKNTLKLPTKKIKGDVVFENVNFGYAENQLVIKNFSAKIKAGQKVALVGPTGSGKTTIVNLLMRFYELNSGKIFIDGKDIRKINRHDLHNAFGMVLQDTWLFEGTVRENLVYNQQNVTDEKLDEICETCGLTHFIKTLPNGYDTILDDNTNISQGQKQLLTIARAMVQNCPMLILDEATSSIDTRTEAIIQKAIDKLTLERTSFVIAHRLSTIKNADIILVLKDGELIEQGNHKKLLSLNGLYAELYNSQFTTK